MSSRLRRMLSAYLVLTLTVCAVASAQEYVWIPSKIEGCDQCTVTNLHFVTPKDGWAVAYRLQDYFRLDTNDFGATWTTEAIDFPEYARLNRSTFLTPREGWSPADTYVTYSHKGRVDGHNPGEDNSFATVRFFRTVDGGITWTLKEGPIEEIAYFGDEQRARRMMDEHVNLKYLSVIEVLDRNRFILAGLTVNEFVGYGYVVVTTTDGGSSWKAHQFGPLFEGKPCTMGDEPQPIYDISAAGESVFIPALSWWCRFVYLLVTHDGGQSWSSITLIRQKQETVGKYVYFVTDTDGWSSGGKTTDGGRTWTKEGFPVGALLFLTPLEGWTNRSRTITLDGSIARQFEIYRTADGGTTWALEYAQPGDQSLQRFQYDVATKRLWGFGHLILSRAVSAGVTPQDRLPLVWGTLKRGAS